MSQKRAYFSFGECPRKLYHTTETQRDSPKRRFRQGTLPDPIGTEDPWKATGSMVTPRVGHPAVLLANGKVLVAGGGSFRRPKWYKVAAAELYDPNTGTWSSTGSMSTGRYEQGMALLPNGQALAVGGLSNSNTALATAEVYTP